MLCSDRIFTGFFELPEIGKLPVIQPNLPELPELPSKFKEITILVILVRFGPILVAKKWQNTKWRQIAPNLEPCHIILTASELKFRWDLLGYEVRT